LPTTMKFVIFAVIALACFAAADDNENLRLTSVRLTVPIGEPVEYTREPVAIQRGEVPPPQNIDIATIITIGKTVWEIIKDGKPVVDYSSDWAGAIPKGVAWNDLEGFKDYRWGPFGWDFSNILGMDNVKFSWNFVWSCKGSYNGHGAFIMNAGASIIEIYAAWGYTVNVNVSVDKNPINYGTKVDPIAGLAVEVTFDLRSVIQSFTERCRVSLRGNCATAKISCA